MYFSSRKSFSHCSPLPKMFPTCSFKKILSREAPARPPCSEADLSQDSEFVTHQRPAPAPRWHVRPALIPALTLLPGHSARRRALKSQPKQDKSQALGVLGNDLPLQNAPGLTSHHAGCHGWQRRQKQKSLLGLPPAPTAASLCGLHVLPGLSGHQSSHL